MRLRIRLSAHWQDAASNCAWALLDDDGNVRDSGTGTLASMPQADEAVAIVAADRVLSTAATLPDLKRNKLETALPFVLEEGVLDDVSEMHVIPGSKLPDGRTVLFVLNKGWLARFLAACSAAKLRVRRIVPEYCMLPVRNGEWSVAWDGAQGFIAQAGYLGGALDGGSDTRLPVSLHLRLRQNDTAALRMFTLASGVEAPNLDIKVPVLFERQQFDWRKADIPNDAPNLMWGKFAPPPRIGELGHKLRPALMAALLLLGVETVLTNLEWAVLANEKHRLTSAMNDTFRETFGADAVVVDAPLQMRRNIAGLRHAAGVADDADFLPLLEKFSVATDGLSGRTVNTIRYEAGKLDVEMRLDGTHTTDLLRQRLTEAGLSVQVTDTQTAGDTLTLHLRVSAGGAR
ncbi:MAG: type II secretion system protein GspL [Sideroxydans sp.]